MEARKQWDNLFQVLKETVNQKFYIQQNFSSKMKEKLKIFPEKQKVKVSSLEELLYKKFKRGFFRLK